MGLFRPQVFGLPWGGKHDPPEQQQQKRSLQQIFMDNWRWKQMRQEVIKCLKQILWYQ